MDESHILVSLGDDNVKKISEVIGNKTCNKILDFLSREEATVTDISRKLKIPLNTADYNVKKLVSAGLIGKSSHFWSVRGKKMPTYKVLNRKIIISPKVSKAKSFFWAFLLTGLFAFVLRNFMGTSEYTSGVGEVRMSAQELAFDSAVNEGAKLAASAPAASSASGAASASFFVSMGAWAWFLIGAWVAIVMFFVIGWFLDRK